jgi:transcriptional coactivator HFI1/ADA1
MLPYCYEAGLASGHSSEAAQFMTIAAEAFVKEVLASIFNKTRSNGPGESGSAGFGIATMWIQTHKYRRQLAREEDAALHGEITRDKSGLLPIEAKAASERGPLGMADVRIALDMGECGIGRFPVLTTTILNNYREGELEHWDDYTWIPGQEAAPAMAKTSASAKLNGGSSYLPNGHAVELMDIDTEMWWDGAETQDATALDSVLDSCLAVGS